MESIINSLYQVGYDIWNQLIAIAMTMFTTSPTAAAGGIYNTTKTLFDAISDISIPIAIVFFFVSYNPRCYTNTT